MFKVGNRKCTFIWYFRVLSSSAEEKREQKNYCSYITTGCTNKFGTSLDLIEWSIMMNCWSKIYFWYKTYFWSKLTSNDLKWPQIISKYFKLPQITSNNLKWPQMTSNDHKWTEMASNDMKKPQMTWNNLKLFKIDLWYKIQFFEEICLVTLY